MFSHLKKNIHIYIYLFLVFENFGQESLRYHFLAKNFSFLNSKDWKSQPSLECLFGSIEKIDISIYQEWKSLI